jgi:F1F0 ATPase subunit 2
MNEFVSLTVALAAGVLLGAIFFGGLWWTVRKGVSSQRPALWFFGSLLSRMSITLAGFYLVARENWERWLLCLIGFVLTRRIARWLTRSPGRNQTGPVPAQEASYAPQLR